MARLAKDVLAEIPDQFLSYMRTRGIKPSPAPPPYTPPGQPLQTQIWGVNRESGSWIPHTQNTFISLKQLYMPCHLGSRWRFSCQEGACWPGDCHFSAQEKPMKVCLLPLSSIPLSVWIFFFWSYILLPGNLETVWRVKIKLRDKGSPEDEGTRAEGPLFHWRKNVSRQRKLDWPFCK